VFVVRGRLAIRRADGPAVGVHGDLLRAAGDHRLDAERHPGAELLAGPPAAEVRHLRVFVHAPPDPVADEVAHDAVATRLAVRLHRVADVADPVPLHPITYALVERLFRRAQEVGPLLGYFAHTIRVGEVPEV